MTLGCDGSIARAVAPRDDPKLDRNVWPDCPPKETVLGCACVNVAPPSVDFQTPTPGVPGGIWETAPAVVEEMPCTPRPLVTYIVLPIASLGSIAMVRIARLVKFPLPPNGFQVLPPSVDL